MRVFMSALAVSAVVGIAACAEAPAEDPPGTEATSQDLLATAGAADLPTGSLPPGAPRALAEQPDPQSLDIAVLGFDRGSQGAPVRVVEFSDYGCGYCRKFHLETWPTLLREFVDPGKIEWKFLPYVSGMFENSTAATTAAECVLEQDDTLYITMNGLVWDRQSDWKRASDPAPVLRDLAAESGADLTRYEACVANGRRARRVEAATAVAAEMGVRATPTFFVVGYPPLQGALPTDVFLQVLNMVYEEATRAGGND